MICSCGASVRPGCRSKHTCSHGRFEKTHVTCICNDLGVGCPSTSPQLNGPCSTEGAVCAYSTGHICVYTSRQITLCIPPPWWACMAPPASPCLKYAPNQGQPCTSPNLSCSYGSCSSLAIEAVCSNADVWQWRQQIHPL